MTKNDWLKIAGWFGIVLMILASIGMNSFGPYILQGLYLVYVLLYAYGKAHSKIIVVAGALFFFAFRLIGYDSAYDLIDLALWGSIFAIMVSGDK